MSGEVAGSKVGGTAGSVMYCRAQLRYCSVTGPRGNKKNYLETKENEKTDQNLWNEAKAILRKKFSEKCRHQETRKMANSLMVYTPRN